jgi:hypothetical protein
LDLNSTSEFENVILPKNDCQIQNVDAFSTN